MSQGEEGSQVAETLVLTCKVADFDASTGECSAPFYSYPPTLFPYLNAEDGLQIAFAIVGTWTLGVVARLYIRATQQEGRNQ
ncbi:hypothetical protein [Pseudoxanthomonas sp. SE1]|jgi:hypothetical protein|uniref:hypothetical protein n=1 Tax=Pseudoxanthomonas sp. SE1 TaxID=1664560 RepID=UPI00240E1A30|nr:hypothetical protein [Pseudoxanthomonas sp. SE1]WFC43768.1 hypothetical protein OY559_09855 [Pseudoxanthomonas sp. SE1]